MKSSGEAISYLTGQAQVYFAFKGYAPLENKYQISTILLVNKRIYSRQGWANYWQLVIVVLLSLSKRTTCRKMKRKLKLYLVQRDIGNERVCWLGSDMMAMAFRNVRKLMIY